MAYTAKRSDVVRFRDGLYWIRQVREELKETDRGVAWVPVKPTAKPHLYVATGITRTRKIAVVEAEAELVEFGHLRE